MEKAVAFASQMPAGADIVTSLVSFDEMYTLAWSDLDGGTCAWHRTVCTGPIPCNRFCGCSATGIFRSTLVMFGGADLQLAPKKKAFGNDLWTLDLVTGEWQQTEEAAVWPAARTVALTAVVGGSMVMLGGWGYAADKKSMEDVWVLDLGSMRWSKPQQDRKGFRPRLSSLWACEPVSDKIVCLANTAQRHAEGGCVAVLDTLTWQWTKVGVGGWCKRDGACMVKVPVGASGSREPPSSVKFVCFGGTTKNTKGHINADLWAVDAFEIIIEQQDFEN